ncbi:MAG: ETC complex I subunit [Sphingomonadales bacterium]
MRARIYRPAKSAMQSGRANSKAWVLEFEPRMAKRPDPLMGWAGSADTLGQVKLRFPSKDDAVAYASKHGIDFRVLPEHRRSLPLRSYAENFK